MARDYVSLQNLRFMLHKVFTVSDFGQHPYFEGVDEDAMNMMLDAAKQLADAYLFPHYEDMDRNEPELEGDSIRVHKSVLPYMEACGEGGWLGATAPAEDGGLQMPDLLGICAGFIMGAANNGATGFSGLTTGAANLLVSFASSEQKERYLPNMYGGKWQGTMALTEPQAGSSLSDITTSAKPMEDGSYRIKGQKIYISGGDYIGIENVVHLTLARIEGAPKGTKGISLFIVPKHRFDDQENLTPNDVTTAGVYHKMGQKGTPATHLMFGEKDDCHGYLVGQAHKGLNYMFQMMNEARVMVGVGAGAIASAAYYASLQFAKERPQGRRFQGGARNLEEGQTLIIHHPDVKRMLLFQKSIVEGALGLVMQAGYYADKAKVSEGAEKEQYELLLDVMTPVVKSFPSEMAIHSISAGVQILGGGGFCKDFPLENYYRDIRIYPIYEGTTGIQAQDLLGRKMTMHNGESVKLLAAEIQQTIEAAHTFEDLRPYIQKLQDALQQWQMVSMHLISNFAMKGQIERFLSDATLFLELSGIIMVAWQWLKQAAVAKEAILTENPSGDHLLFLESKLHTMKFYFHYELPKTQGLVTRLMDDEVLTITGEKEYAI